MKKSILIILTFAALLTSCSKNLEVPSEASIDANAEMSTADVDRLLTGLFIAIDNPSSYGYFQILYPCLLADNFVKVKFQWFQVNDAAEHSIHESDILNEYNYKNFYKGVSRANFILGLPATTNVQAAQAKYCRALSYFRLVDLYGDVPLVDENYDGKPIAKSTVAEIYNFMISDLLFAKKNAPAFNDKNAAVSNTMPTQEAAQALLARVYRLKGDITAAAAEAESLITSGKFSLSTNPLQRTSEVIMRFANNPDVDNARWGYIMSTGAKTWNCIAASPNLTKLLDADDTRNILYEVGEVNKVPYTFCVKYDVENNSDLLISRIAEMYLISAEAGNTARLTELQAIRKSSLSLADERRLELAFEWVRWSDMKHAGLTNYLVPLPLAAIKANPLLK